MFREALLLLCDKKYHGYIIYAHNLSGFDGIFLLRHLLRHGKIKPLLHNGRLISIESHITIDDDSATILFKDSYLLLPQSLRNLCKAFSVETIKTYFPFNFNNIPALTIILDKINFFNLIEFTNNQIFNNFNFF